MFLVKMLLGLLKWITIFAGGTLMVLVGFFAAGSADIISGVHYSFTTLETGFGISCALIFISFMLDKEQAKMSR
ncbi:MAG: hypothetical protein KGI60_02725 [Patescibacteria group bacterium]|nr:hypothetical protein [Patescibacteria group bacterium]